MGPQSRDRKQRTLLRWLGQTQLSPQGFPRAGSRSFPPCYLNVVELLTKGFH